MFELKKYRGVILHDTEEKLTCGLESNMRNLANFHKSTWMCQNWDFDGILLSKVKNPLAKNYRGVMCNNKNLKSNNKKFKEELIFRFKIDMRNLTNFDPRTQKSQTFSL